CYSGESRTRGVANSASRALAVQGHKKGEEHDSSPPNHFLHVDSLYLGLRVILSIVSALFSAL
ncbi:MAG: hypothetical protein AAF756_09260, partial [Pseudomonadota bacterium]